MEIKVSLIISVFNGEKYLRECLDSVIRQTLKEIEVICLNDGSTDKSKEILAEYSKDSRFKIINQENIGLGASRNKGMELAKGEYIAFLDADDWLVDNALETAYNEAKNKNTDITMFQMINYKENTGEEKKNDWFNLDKFDKRFKDTVFNNQQTKDFLFHLSVSACQKIYKRSYLERINAKFPEGIYFEDAPFFFNIWLRANRISIIKEYLYYRRSHENSITAKCDEKFFDVIPSGEEFFKIFVETGNYEIYKEELINFAINAYRLTLNSITEDAVEEFYKRSKKQFKKIVNSPYIDDFKKYMSKGNQDTFNNVLNSKDYEEFKKLNVNSKGNF